MVPNESRRDLEVRAAILRAVHTIAAEKGYAAVTVEGIARLAGAGKQTVYRWWPSLSAVVLDALLDATRSSATFPDTGDLRADLRTQMRRVVRQFNSPLMRLYTGLIGSAQSDPALASQLYERVVAPRALDCGRRIAAAQADGSVREDVDPKSVVEQLYAPLYYRLLVTHEPVTNRQVDTVLDLVLAGLVPAPSRR